MIKKFFIFFLLFLSILQVRSESVSEHQGMMEKHLGKTTHDYIDIAILVYPNVVLQDFAGPLEVFSKANNLSKGKYRTVVVADSMGVIKTENEALSITPDFTLNTMPEIDYLFIPGANMRVINSLVKKNTFSPLIHRWNDSEGTRLVSVCTGAYLLANTGLLDGRKATTHFFVADDFAKQFPSINLIRDVRFVDDGKYITSSGVTSGIDAALHIIDLHSGRKMRAMIARAMQHQFRNEEDWPVSPNGMRYSRASK